MTGAATQPLRGLDHVRHVVAEVCFPFEPPEPRRSSPGRVGLETEAFHIDLPAAGSATRRVPIDRLVQLLDELATAPFATRRSLPGSPGYLLTSGSSLSFEPGGQLEHSTLPHPSPAASLDEVEAANVLLVRRTSTAWEPGWPGWTFGDWLWHGHPRHGRPSVDDLRYHLTTLFLEVRPRGFLELRAIDALPARWRCSLDPRGAADPAPSGGARLPGRRARRRAHRPATGAP